MNFGALFYTLWGVGYLLTIYFNAVTILIAVERDAHNGRVGDDDRGFAWFVAGFAGLWMWPFIFLGSIAARLKWRLRSSGRGPLLRTPNEQARAKAAAEQERNRQIGRDMQELQRLAKENGLPMPPFVGEKVSDSDSGGISPGFVDLVADLGGSAGFVEKLREAEKAS
jgi:hypothetical protein